MQALFARRGVAAANLSAMRRPLAAALAAAAMASLALAPSARAATGEVVDRSTLKVCADPGNLPYSNDKGEGFENKIAELIASDLGVPIEYTWFPQTVGFVRMTLAAKRCDLIIGVATTNELMQNSNPYYHSTYVMVRRADTEVSGLDDPILKTMTIGVQPRTPVASLLARRGLLTRLKSYRLVVDTRLEKPIKAMVEDVAAGEIDVALAWGPLAGYWARETDPTLVVTPVAADPSGPRLSYRISMGLRYNEPEWKHTLNEILKQRQDDINAILASYGVPLLDTLGRPIVIKAEATDDDAPFEVTVEEPDDYRVTDYRAPVPAGLKGATTVNAAGLKDLLAGGGGVLIDVYPAARKPEKLSPTAIWNEPKRDTVQGAHWLANMGLGRLHESEAEAFRGELAALSDNGAKPLVFFCEPECWMSWNAAKRALEFGFKNVVWFPGGVTRWQEAGGALETVRPWRPDIAH
ncbi:quinoprotein dehydrogenase-associated putative ABC transporter substrate-binding protein [Breoghania sp. L-A4]|uniref:quinoprotein dehydrogenase-associated putative ABC transporter substrate-binding protein n=1 Tax=Breoghania sp. L-A4 TaxID=2304600 RepID=UPI0013C2E998|nr:quinoprotein dehydrogenase-associated putative ABC transporter substrate-binding protein [Breoghania sp. L-A4]